MTFVKSSFVKNSIAFIYGKYRNEMLRQFLCLVRCCQRCSLVSFKD